jgi:hypothetical protein
MRDSEYWNLVETAMTDMEQALTFLDMLYGKTVSGIATETDRERARTAYARAITKAGMVRDITRLKKERRTLYELGTNSAV